MSSIVVPGVCAPARDEPPIRQRLASCVAAPPRESPNCCSSTHRRSRRAGPRWDRYKDIVVGELRFRVHLEVLIADIASSDERYCVVGDYQFVVHSIVEPRGVEEKLHASEERRMATIRERIENTDFDGMMSVERKDLFVARNSGPIVHQNAYAHAAIGRAQQRLGQQPARFIAAKNEILKIQGTFGSVDHLRPDQKPVDADRDDAKSRSPVVFLRRACKLSAETGFLRVSERDGDRLGKIGTRRKRCTARERRGEEQDLRKADGYGVWTVLGDFVADAGRSNAVLCPRVH